MTKVRVEKLTKGDKLGQGGQGTVWALPGRKINGEWPVAYKEYSAVCRDELDGPALDAMVEFVPGLPTETGLWLCERLAWPAAVVLDDRGRCGILMRLVPDGFFIDSPQAGRNLAGFQFLLNDEGYLRRVGISITVEQRLQLLLDLSRTLAGLHRLGVVVGDLSPKNVLFRLGAEPSCFLIDCDAMRVDGRDALDQRETPDWSLPQGEPLATGRGDSYKFGLLVVRLLAGEQDSRDTGAVGALSADLGRLAAAAIGTDPARRPELADWERPLLRAIEELRTPSAPDPDEVAAWIGATLAAGAQHPAPPRPPGTPAPAPPAATPPGPGRVLATVVFAGLLVWAGVKGVSALGDDSGTGSGSSGSAPAAVSTYRSTPYGSGGTSGGTTGGGTTGGSGTTAVDPVNQAKAIDLLLNRNDGTRKVVTSAVQAADGCGNTVDVRYGASQLRQAAAGRDSLVARLQGVDTSALPGGANLAAQLSSAWTASAAADRAFARWADDVAGCDGNAPHTADWNEGYNQSQVATAAKKAFAAAWNPLADRYGLAHCDPDAI
ncbi:hypothetical protein [Streptomyces sp. 1331.2]|uniref:hypothetical protein n=1 Tax=Streptomyces sp. 1331.2 TaxID=1938835 RepID=UPI000BD0F1BF|nr:hypothetical protein [Streptomyces sp. 1331.2]SOB83760.1 hypothetical protein SAMN06272789_3974 [Streptomyces sp. 1331.2]